MATGREFWYVKFYFINLFHVFALDNNFCFFEHANQLTPVQINILDFIHKIYDGSISNLATAIWSWTVFY